MHTYYLINNKMMAVKLDFENHPTVTEYIASSIEEIMDHYESYGTHKRILLQDKQLSQLTFNKRVWSIILKELNTLGDVLVLSINGTNKHLAVLKLED